MRWLMIGFLVSLVALLIAAAGLARHIVLRHSQRPGKTVNRAQDLKHDPKHGLKPDPNLDPADETEL
jgi:hypothetical protein